MRKILLIVPAVIGLSACGNNSRNTPTDTPQSDCVEVLCFHGAKRCATCIANVRTNPKKFKAELRAEIQRQIDE